MARSPEEHIEKLTTQAQQQLTDVRVIRRNVAESRALLNLEAIWRGYRIVIQEIHRADSSMRYSYYVLDENNIIVWGFDNSPDRRAIKLFYGINWKAHQHKEVPHQHDANGNVTLTSTLMTFEIFVEWLFDTLCDEDILL